MDSPNDGLLTGKSASSISALWSLGCGKTIQAQGKEKQHLIESLPTPSSNFGMLLLVSFYVHLALSMPYSLVHVTRPIERIHVHRSSFEVQ